MKKKTGRGKGWEEDRKPRLHAKSSPETLTGADVWLKKEEGALY